MKSRIINIILITGLLPIFITAKSKNEIIVGSKKFTESVILGEVLTKLITAEGQSSFHKRELGGTRILWNALLEGEIDLYVEYTGTIIEEILSEKNLTTSSELKNVLNEYSIEISEPLGFNNTYALGMLKQVAEKKNINSISDLLEHPELKFGFTNEFMDRGDGWPSLKAAYSLPQKDVVGIDHDIAYRGLASNSIDVIDLYSTDAEINYYNIKILNDDFNHFTNYNAVILFRKELLEGNAGLMKSILRLENSIDEQTMISLNEFVKIKGSSEKETAANFIKQKFLVDSNSAKETVLTRLLNNSKQHLFLVTVSMFFAIIVSIPFGIAAYKNKFIGQIVLSLAGIIQTIPSLAILVFMIPLFGIGAEPAIIALFLYSLLPIVRNTFLGLKDIDMSLKESAIVLGLSRKAILQKIELPLAARSIITGIKISSVINIGTATLGALIGAGGFGQPILTGIRLDNIQLILEGAVPAALLAIAVQYFFDLIEKIVVPKGVLNNSH